MARWVCAATLVLAAGCGQSPTAPRTVAFPLPGGSTAFPPVIKSFTVPQTRREAGVDIPVSVSVEDQDTPVSQLEFLWSANMGTIAGSGASAVFRLNPGIQKGVDVVVSVTVVDKVTVKGGTQVLQEFRVSGQSSSFRVHDSVAELKELGRRFLIDLFGHSEISPLACLVDFSQNGPCKQGYDDELSDLNNHRRDYLVLERYLLNQNVVFTGADTARVDNNARFVDMRLSDLFIGRTEGNFPLTGVYEGSRWWLCSSGFDDDLAGDGGLATIKRKRGRTLINK